MRSNSQESHYIILIVIITAAVGLSLSCNLFGGSTKNAIETAIQETADFDQKLQTAISKTEGAKATLTRPTQVQSTVKPKPTSTTIKKTVQSSSSMPRLDPSDNSIPTWKISMYDAKIVGLRFFESGTTIPALGDREYKTTFKKSTTRHITWELEIDYPSNNTFLPFTLDQEFITYNNSICTNDPSSNGCYWRGGYGITLPANQTKIWQTGGLGQDEAGTWMIAKYLVNLYVIPDRFSREKIASGTFEIVP